MTWAEYKSHVAANWATIGITEAQAVRFAELAALTDGLHNPTVQRDAQDQPVLHMAWMTKAYTLAFEVFPDGSFGWFFGHRLGGGYCGSNEDMREVCDELRACVVRARELEDTP